MQSVAAWLVARPINAVVALAGTVSLTYLSFLSSVVLVLLVLEKGARAAVIYVAIASALMAVAGLILQLPLQAVVLGPLLFWWMPALLLGVVLTVTRSLTLTVQLTAVIAVVFLGVLFLIAGDLADFWRSVIGSIIELWREMGLNEQADFATANMTAIVENMTVMAVLTIWGTQTVCCVLGYWLFRQLPDKSAIYGRFRNLTFGRVIALIMALAAVAALLSEATWAQNIAFVLFAMFSLQGMAIVHWMHGQGHLPVFGVIAVYVLLPILNVILLMGLAMFGYIDAWFGFRRKRAA